MTGRRNSIEYPQEPQGCVDATGHGHSRTELRGCKKHAYPPENPLLDDGGRSDMLSNSQVNSDFKLIEVRQHGDRYRIVMETDQVAVKEILRFLSLVHQFTQPFFYKVRANAVSDEKEQARLESLVLYKEWCVKTVLPVFRLLEGTDTERFRKMREWLNNRKEAAEHLGPREKGYLRQEVEALISSARKFERERCCWRGCFINK
ncbi:MAG: hypothetical protein HZB86_02550 [Deltaproteobacteria bacterium]|nr:hypothetical protein [Deltaproteobacteria bacterium]